MAIDNPLYSIELTEAERSLGFELVETHNPGAGYAFADARMRAVVRKLGPSDRVIKTVNLMNGGKPVYKLQRFGVQRFAQEVPPEWHALGTTVFETPEGAIQAYPQTRDQAPPNDILKSHPEDFPPTLEAIRRSPFPA